MNGHVLVETKSVDSLRPVDHAQLRSYLRASGMTLGVLVNFHEARMKDGYHAYWHPAIHARMRVARAEVSGSGSPGSS